MEANGRHMQAIMCFSLHCIALHCIDLCCMAVTIACYVVHISTYVCVDVPLRMHLSACMCWCLWLVVCDGCERGMLSFDVDVVMG